MSWMVEVVERIGALRSGGRERATGSSASLVYVLGSRVGAVCNVRSVCGDRIRQDPLEVRVLANELGDATGAESGPVCPDQKLAVDMRTGTNADSRDAQFLGHLSGGLGWNHFQHHRERTGIFDGVRVGEKLVQPFAASLNYMSTEAVFTLRSETDVSHDRNPGGNDATNLLSTAHAALQLHGVSMRLLHETECRMKCLFGAGLVRTEREVGD